MRPLEAMLYGQATALQSMFVDLSRRPAIQQHLPQFQAHLSLALTAQAQSRSTILALAAPQPEDGKPSSSRPTSRKDRSK